MFHSFICYLKQVWIVVFGVLLGITILVYLLDKFSPFSYRNRKEHFPDGGKIYSLKESAWFVMGAFTKSGNDFDIPNWSLSLLNSKPKQQHGK